MRRRMLEGKVALVAGVTRRGVAFCRTAVAAWQLMLRSSVGMVSRCRVVNLQRSMGFTDIDGSQPDAWCYIVEMQDAGKPPDVTVYKDRLVAEW